MSVKFRNVKVEHRFAHRQVIVMTIDEGFHDMLVDLYRYGFRIVEKVYPYLYLEGDALHFQREEATDMTEEVVVNLPSAEMAELANHMLGEERSKL